jgi:hypothetical protein
MDARAREAAMLARCVEAARSDDMVAQNAREANVFCVAAAVIRTRFPLESKNLLAAGTHYFEHHPADRLHPSEVVVRGWIFGFPRLRDMLTRLLVYGVRLDA